MTTSASSTPSATDRSLILNVILSVANVIRLGELALSTVVINTKLRLYSRSTTRVVLVKSIATLSSENDTILGLSLFLKTNSTVLITCVSRCAGTDFNSTGSAQCSMLHCSARYLNPTINVKYNVRTGDVKEASLYPISMWIFKSRLPPISNHIEPTAGIDLNEKGVSSAVAALNNQVIVLPFVSSAVASNE